MANFDADAVLAKAKSRAKSKTDDSEKSIFVAKRASLPAANLHSGTTSISTQNIRRLPAMEIDPSKCKPWKYHNRDAEWLNKENCSDLIKSLESNGQIEPGLVRKIANDPNYDYEIIYGVRRWYSSSQINGKKFLARVTKADDRECMILMHIENADSKDISDFERAYSFLQQIRSGAFESQKDLAMAMNVSQGLVTRMIQAAEIFDYAFVAELLTTKKDLPIRSCQQLSALLKQPSYRNKIQAKCSGLKGTAKNNPKGMVKQMLAFAHDMDIASLLEVDAKNLRGIQLQIDSKGRMSITLLPKARQNNPTLVEKTILEAVKKYLIEG